MKKLVSSLAIASVLVSGLYAGQNQSCDMKKDGQNHKMSDKNGKKYNKHNKHGGVLGLFNELNLTKEQQTKIDEIVKANEIEQVTIFDAFSKDSFDKEKFSKIRKENQEKRFEKEANIVAESYKVLDAKQKEQLKTLIDLRKEKMQSRFSTK